MAEAKRFRLTVPAEDVSVLRWIEAQQNQSYSIRQLIRDAIRRNGYADVTCSEVEQLPRRGRPPKDEDVEEAYEQKPKTTTMEEDVQPRWETQPPKAPPRQSDDDGFVDPSAFF